MAQKDYKLVANTLLASIQSCNEQKELSDILNNVSLFCKGPQNLESHIIYFIKADILRFIKAQLQNDYIIYQLRYSLFKLVSVLSSEPSVKKVVGVETGFSIVLLYEVQRLTKICGKVYDNYLTLSFLSSVEKRNLHSSLTSFELDSVVENGESNESLVLSQKDVKLLLVVLKTLKQLVSTSLKNDDHIDVINDILDLTQVAIEDKDKVKSAGGSGVLSLLHSVDIVDGIELKHTVQFLVYSILIDITQLTRGTLALFSDTFVFKELTSHFIRFAVPDIAIPIVCKSLLNIEVEQYSKNYVKKIDINQYLSNFCTIFKDYLKNNCEISFVQSKMTEINVMDDYADLDVDSQILKSTLDSFLELKLIFGSSINNFLNYSDKVEPPNINVDFMVNPDFQSINSTDISNMKESSAAEFIPISRNEPLNIFNYLKNEIDSGNLSTTQFLNGIDIVRPNILPHFSSETTLTNSNLLVYLMANFSSNYDLHLKILNTEYLVLYFDFVYSLLSNFDGFCLSHIAHLNKLAEKLEKLEYSKFERFTKFESYFTELSISSTSMDYGSDLKEYADIKDHKSNFNNTAPLYMKDNVGEIASKLKPKDEIEVLVLDHIKDNISIWRTNLELILYSGLKIERIISTPITILLTSLLNIFNNPIVFFDAVEYIKSSNTNLSHLWSILGWPTLSSEIYTKLFKLLSLLCRQPDILPYITPDPGIIGFFLTLTKQTLVYFSTFGHFDYQKYISIQSDFTFNPDYISYLYSMLINFNIKNESDALIISSLCLAQLRLTAEFKSNSLFTEQAIINDCFLLFARLTSNFEYIIGESIILPYILNIAICGPYFEYDKLKFTINKSSSKYFPSPLSKFLVPFFLLSQIFIIIKRILKRSKESSELIMSNCLQILFIRHINPFIPLASRLLLPEAIFLSKLPSFPLSMDQYFLSFPDSKNIGIASARESLFSCKSEKSGFDDENEYLDKENNFFESLNKEGTLNESNMATKNADSARNYDSLFFEKDDGELIKNTKVDDNIPDFVEILNDIDVVKTSDIQLNLESVMRNDFNEKIDIPLIPLPSPVQSSKDFEPEIEFQIKEKNKKINYAYPLSLQYIKWLREFMNLFYDYLQTYMPTNTFNVQFYPNIPLAQFQDETYTKLFLSSAQFFEATMLYSIFTIKMALPNGDNFSMLKNIPQPTLPFSNKSISLGFDSFGKDEADQLLFCSIESLRLCKMSYFLSKLMPQRQTNVQYYLNFSGSFFNSNVEIIANFLFEFISYSNDIDVIDTTFLLLSNIFLPVFPIDRSIRSSLPLDFSKLSTLVYSFDYPIMDLSTFIIYINRIYGSSSLLLDNLNGKLLESSFFKICDLQFKNNYDTGDDKDNIDYDLVIGDVNKPRKLFNYLSNTFVKILGFIINNNINGACIRWPGNTEGVCDWTYINCSTLWVFQFLNLLIIPLNSKKQIVSNTSTHLDLLIDNSDLLRIFKSICDSIISIFDPIIWTKTIIFMLQQVEFYLYNKREAKSEFIKKMIDLFFLPYFKNEINLSNFSIMFTSNKSPPYASSLLEFSFANQLWPLRIMLLDPLYQSLVKISSQYKSSNRDKKSIELCPDIFKGPLLPGVVAQPFLFTETKINTAGNNEKGSFIKPKYYVPVNVDILDEKSTLLSQSNMNAFKYSEKPFSISNNCFLTSWVAISMWIVIFVQYDGSLILILKENNVLCLLLQLVVSLRKLKLSICNFANFNSSLNFFVSNNLIENIFRLIYFSVSTNSISEWFNHRQFLLTFAQTFNSISNDLDEFSRGYMLKLLNNFAECAVHYYIILKNSIYKGNAYIWHLTTLKECLPTLIKLSGNFNYSEIDKALIWSTLLLINNVLYRSVLDKSTKEISLKSNIVNDSNFTREIIHIGKMISEKKYSFPAGLLSEDTKSELRLLKLKDNDKPTKTKEIISINNNNSIVDWVEDEYLKLLNEN